MFRVKTTIFFMEDVITIDQYNQTIKKLESIMNLEVVNEARKGELLFLLDQIDSYNGMDYLKVNAIWNYSNDLKKGTN